MLEGLAITINTMLMKLLGISYEKIDSKVFFLILMIGVVQFVSAFFLIKRNNIVIVHTLKEKIYSLLIGCISALMTVLFMSAFILGADAGVATFIITLAIIPKIFFDRFLFLETISTRQYLGVIIFLGLVCILLQSNPNAYLNLNEHTWLWLIILFVVAFLAAVNETVARMISNINIIVSNYYIGIAHIICAVITITIFWAWPIALSYDRIFYAVTFLMGIVVIATLSCRLRSYRSGSSLMLKSMFLRIFVLVVVILAAYLIYSEPITFGKRIAIAGFPFAFWLTRHKSLNNLPKGS